MPGFPPSNAIFPSSFARASDDESVTARTWQMSGGSDCASAYFFGEIVRRIPALGLDKPSGGVVA
jgi:hypothetical protein